MRRLVFRVHCLILVYKTHYEWFATLYRNVQLPFPPFPGLELKDEDWEFTVECVCYNVSEEIFECPVDDRPAVGEKRSSEDLADIIADYVAAGWKPLKGRVAE